MKKLLLSFLVFPLLVLAQGFPIAAMAGGSSTPKPPDQSQSNIVELSYAQRVLIFTSEYNSVSVDGIILVCQYPNIGDGRGTCLNKDNQNAWVEASRIVIPGYVLTGFEYRYAGLGFRHLILYFKAK
jgi:hypothetical protein